MATAGGTRAGEARGPLVVRRAAVVTVSDRCARGEQADGSGDRIATRLRGLPVGTVERRVVADEAAQIADVVGALTADCGLVISTGGTGPAPRDVTPDAVRPLLDREIPGMGEAMRAAGRASTPLAMLSRQFGGVRGACLILVLPGSIPAVEESLDAVWPVLPHVLGLISGRDPSHPVPAG